MTSKEEQEVKDQICKALLNAKNIWNDVGHEFANEEFKRKAVLMSESKTSTQIPGFPFINENKPKVDDFIALVLDIRNSTKHLIEAHSPGPSQLERVLYETYAVYALGQYIIEKNSGGITEYLGDGFLSLFLANEKKSVHKAKKAADECLDGMKIVNEVLEEKYGLPPLYIGIGLAYSKAIVTLVGTGKNIQPKVIGECVYRASKLSSGKNKMLFDKRLNYFWPTTKGGSVRFKAVNHKYSIDVDGYQIEKRK